jgi:hypothetical protein
MAGPNPISVWRAKRAFKEFTGHDATKSQVEKLDNNDVAGYRLGDVVGIAYEATRDGEKDQYFHRFKKQARPQLVSRSDGRQLYISGGKYHVTDRGIEDKEMPHLFVVNPSRRKKRAKSTRARTRSGQFRKNPTKRKVAPAMAKRRRRTRRVSFRRNPVVVMRSPTRRKRRGRAMVRRASGRRYRRNPGRRLSLGGRGGINVAKLILPGVMIGAGAVGVEVIMGYLPLPAVVQTGPAKYATKGVIAALAGWGIAKFINRRAGEAFAMGGIAIAAHDAIKSAVMGFVPNLKFGEYMQGYNWDKYGYNTPSMSSMRSPGIGYYSPGSTLNTMGEYMPGMAGGGQIFEP